MRLWVLLFICCLADLVSAQENAVPQTENHASAVLQGVVRDEQGPVAFAAVGIATLQRNVLTDESGRFLLEELPAGEWKVEVQAVGYKVQERTVTIKSGEAKKLNFILVSALQDFNEVVISGTLQPVERLKSVIPVESYSPAFLRRSAAPGVFESLSLINGVQPQINCNVCNTGDIHINGMEGPYTMVLIDGMPIVSSLSTVYGLSGIPNALIKRIEVVKGPAGILYGSEAMGGVINIVTKEPISAPRFFADLQLTSVEEYNLDLAVRKKIKDWHTMAGVSLFNYSTPRDINEDGFTDITLQERISVFNKWTKYRADTFPASLAFRYLYEQRWGGELNWSPEWKGTDSIYGEYIITSRIEAFGQFGFLLAKEKMLMEYSYNRHVQDSWYGLIPFDGHQETGFIQFRWNKKTGVHQWMSGLPFRYVYYDDNTPGTAGPNGNTPQQTFLPGLFLQDEITLGNKWMLLPGFRMDHHNEHGFISSPRFAAKYSYSKTGMIRFSTGNGFRVVQLFTEDHAALTGAREVIIAESLRPERSWNMNFNINETFQLKGGVLQLDGNLFHTWFTNRITGDFMTDPQRIIYKNLQGIAISRGLSLNLDYTTAAFRYTLGGTYMDVFLEEKGQRTPQLHAPALSGTAGITWNARNRKWTADITSRITGPMYLPVVPNDYRPEKSPWFAIVNLQLTHRTGSWEFYSGVKNLLNFLPQDPILRPFDPFDKQTDIDNPHGYTFDPSYNYAPMMGLRVYAGFRYQFL